MNKKPFFTLTAVTPSVTMLERIVTALQKKQEQSRLWRVRVFAGSAVLSVGALIPVGISLIGAFKASNFGTYLSLIFSDGGVIVSYWKDILASLVESLPFITITALFALIAILLWSVRNMVRFMNNGAIKTA